MFKLFNRQQEVDVNKQDTLQTERNENSFKFRSHSFSTNAALATILCQPCRMDAAEGRIVCKI